jgi:zinc transport system permease protein
LTGNLPPLRYKNGILEYLLLVLVAMTVVVLIRVVALYWFLRCLRRRRLRRYAQLQPEKQDGLFDVLNNFLCSGLWISYDANIPSGAAIVVLSVLCYIIYLRFVPRVGK